MKALNKILLGTTFLASISAYAANVSTTITATDDYRFRGISQSAGDPALQGSLDLELDNGLFGGVWASNIDFDDDGDTEVDYYVGYYTDIIDDLGIDFTLTRYTYPGLSYDSDYNELISNLYYGDFKLELAYSDDFTNTDASASYVGINYEKTLKEQMSVFENITLTLHAGYSSGDYWEDYDIGNYSDYSVGLSSEVKGFEINLNFLFNDIDDGMDVDSSAFRNDNTINLTVSKTFDLGSF